MRKPPLAVLLVCLMLCCGAICSIGAAERFEKKSGGAYAEEIAKWRADRLKDLTSDDGWLTLVGLSWLKPGPNSIGSNPSNDLPLPAGKAPGHVGTILLQRSTLSLTVASGANVTSAGKPVASMTLKTDADGKPTILNIGTLSFYCIKRGDKFGLRVKDSESPARTHFLGLDYYPADPKWRFEAKFEPYDPPKKIRIENIVGMVQDTPSPGAIVFSVNGKVYKLVAINDEGTNQLFIIYGDQTNRRETYGAGRFLYVDPPDKNGNVVLDFNKSYNPPCAFTTFATCPLPPKQNRLPFPVTAGEKKYAGSHG